jgi:hypothetical protein
LRQQRGCQKNSSSRKFFDKIFHFEKWKGFRTTPQLDHGNPQVH